MSYVMQSSLIVPLGNLLTVCILLMDAAVFCGEENLSLQICIVLI